MALTASPTFNGVRDNPNEDRLEVYRKGKLVGYYDDNGFVLTRGGFTAPGADVNVKTYGAKGDLREVADGAITATSRYLSSATAAFTQDDVDKVITIRGAGSGNTSLATTITALLSSTRVEIATAASITVSGAVVHVGTDDSEAIQAAILAAQEAGGGTVVLPYGTYGVSHQGTRTGDSVTIPYCLTVGGDSLHLDVPVCIYAPFGASIELLDGEPFNEVVFLAGHTAAAPHTAPISLINVTFDGNASGQTNRHVDFSVVQSASCTDFTMRDCTITAFSIIGAQIFRNSVGVRIQRCRFDQNGIDNVHSTATAGAATTLTDSTQAWATDQWTDFSVRIVAGTGVGQIRVVSTNTATALTVTVAWGTNPDATSVYGITQASGSLRVESNGVRVEDGCVFVQDFFAGVGHIQMGDNADIQLAAHGMVISDSEFHGGGSGPVIAADGTSACQIIRNIFRDNGNTIGGISVKVSHYIQTGGYIFDSAANLVADNQFFNCRNPIVINSATGTHSASSTNWAAGGKRNIIRNNTVSHSFDRGQRTKMGAATTYPTSYPQCTINGTSTVATSTDITTVSMDVAINEVAGVGVNHNLIEGNQIEILTATADGIVMGSRTSIARGNVIKVLAAFSSANAITNAVGAWLDSNDVLISAAAGSGTFTVVDNTDGRMTGNRVTGLHSNPNMTLVKSTNGYLRGNYFESMNGKVLDLNSSTRGVIEGNDIIARPGPPTFAYSAIAAPTVTATGSTANGTLASGTYYYVVTAVDQDGLESAGSTEQTATIASTGKITLAWSITATSYGDPQTTRWNVYSGQVLGGPYTLRRAGLSAGSYIDGVDVTSTQTLTTIANVGTKKPKYNSGYVTESSGSGTIINGATTSVITHGLSIDPVNVQITFAEDSTVDPVKCWVGTFGASTFTANVKVDPGASGLDFYWRAEA